MERLTKHQHFITGDKNFHLYFSEEDTSAFTKKIIDKLGKLEDIEENIGISLEILFKAMENGIYYVSRTSQKEILFAKSVITNFEKYKGNYCLYIGNEIAIYFKDYGKTWALTKNEIVENQKTLETLTLSDCLSKMGMSIERFLEIFDKGIWIRNTDNELKYWDSWDIRVVHEKLEYQIFRTSMFGYVNVCDFGKTWWIEKPTEEQNEN